MDSAEQRAAESGRPERRRSRHSQKTPRGLAQLRKSNDTAAEVLGRGWGRMTKYGCGRNGSHVVLSTAIRVSPAHQMFTGQSCVDVRKAICDLHSSIAAERP